ncbi:MAG: acetyl-CoA carboxylase carboxyltransferase subunit [Acidimicrobiia bacterium]|nr:acetyl-CoA carboxylase carboxyltransferase subunit [Acidimicrobiia bacterium]
MTDGPDGDWGPLLDDLADRRRAAEAMGGPERVGRHHDAGKLDARARIAHLLDAGSFHELGALVGTVPADGIVGGHGTIDGRPVVVGAEDFTVMGGSIGVGSSAKRYRLAELAGQERVPLVMLLEGAGHRPPMEGEPVHGRAPIDLQQQARLSGRVPVVTGVLGPSAGHGALVAPLSDFAIMSAGAAIFTAGPPVVKESLGEDITKEQLGGPEVAIGSGLIHNVAATDEAVLDDIRTYLSFFGSSAWSYPPSAAQPVDAAERTLDAILDVVPRDNASVYDMREVISMTVDGGGFFQVQPDFGPAMVCALAHVGGQPVAVVANQPAVLAGAIDTDAADKAAHFIQVADAFHLPLVFLADNPGVLAGSASERQGILRAGGRMYAAQTLARVPKLQITLRKAYGFGSMVMAMVSFEGQTLSAGFPGATLGAMGSASSSRAVGADDDQADAIRRAEMNAAYRSASGLGFDDLIDPRQLRNVLLRHLRLALNRRQAAPEPRAGSAIWP